MMIRKTIFTTMLTAFVATTTTAQENKPENKQENKRVQISASAGWTFSDGVSGAEVKVPDKGTYTRIDPLNAFSWGARLGYLVTGHSEVGFLFNQQSTDLDLGGTSSRKIADVRVRNYHGYFAYNFLGQDSILRPYILVGFGATQYSPSNEKVADTVVGNRMLSGTGAAGLKLWPSPKFGLRLEARLTPTRIKSEATGFWCDSYWGCYTTSSAQFANQVEWSGGFMVRF